MIKSIVDALTRKKAEAAGAKEPSGTSAGPASKPGAKAAAAPVTAAPPRARSENQSVANAARSAGISEEEIRRRAYLKWEAAGRPTGDGMHFWVEAESELRQGK